MGYVYTLLSGKKLDSRDFCRYLYKKIMKSARQLHVSVDLSKESKVYCLDDAAIDIIYSLMSDGKFRLKKSAFLHCLRKELELFSGIKRIKFRFLEYSGLRLEIKKMLDALESRHPEIKYSILNAELNSSVS